MSGEREKDLAIHAKPPAYRLPLTAHRYSINPCFFISDVVASAISSTNCGMFSGFVVALRLAQTSFPSFREYTLTSIVTILSWTR